MVPPHTLRLLLGDQLNAAHSWFRECRSDVHYVMMEVRPESEYCRHHIKKIVLFFAAMRAFAQQLTAAGHSIHYISISDAENAHTFAGNISLLLKRFPSITLLEYQHPDEWRLSQLFQTEFTQLGIEIRVADTEHFISGRLSVGQHFAGKKQWLMESFYRHMRRQKGILMQGDEPAGARWNFDADNRGGPPPAAASIPLPLGFGNDFSQVELDIRQAQLPFMGLGFGEVPAPDYPITRAQALSALSHFVVHLLPSFGPWQDAMTLRSGTLWHSLLSFPLNVKLLSPLEVVTAAENAWLAEPEKYPLASVEGFIRQILGWREYIRGVYWARMPHYQQTNALQAHAPLPEWYWTGHTSMQCLHQSITHSLHTGYAHHIQRLMVTGNFAALLGVHPDYVNEWYLGVYVDAIQWVQLPNTHGMSQWADGGVLATKPYVSSGAYIHKMSDYCLGCHYDVKQKTGPRACPFNALYWDFIYRSTDTLARNPRMAQMYATWRKMTPVHQQNLLAHAQWVKDHVNEL